ncbi:MAG: hypothetical protein NC132_04440 [Corallococcus sp.]|nr:hypothetical protein [Corallococcus sp.]MCM1359910.1 hypothetical protein [Corallococcus sp.]MCM1395343.1 hypothetical protein [Corallococcus sp.]
MKSNKSLIAKTVGLVLFTVTLLACIFALSACGHTHEYAEKITKEATCYSVGEKTFTCSCGDSYTQAIDKLEHSFTKYAVDESGHWLVCANNGCTQVDPDTAKSDHEHLTLVFHVDSTCTVQGKDVYKCVCGHEQTTTLNLLEHNFTKYASDDTYHWIVCANKDCTAVDPDTPKTVHSHDTFENELSSSSTCTVQGKNVYSCECGHKQITELPLAPHDFTKREITSANHWMACAACGAVDPDNPKTAHGYVVTETVKAAGCTSQGSEKVQCEVCDYQTTRQTNPLGHDFDNPVLGEHNSTGHRLQCARCSEFIFVRHDSMDADLVGADAECPDGHNKAATCGQNGHQDKTCTVCGEIFHTVISATGLHQPSDWVTTHGTQHWKECPVCGTELERASHANTLQTTKEPTCTEAGRKSMVCTICGRVDAQGSNIDKLGHDYQPTGIVLTPATCTAAGSNETQCSRCHEKSSTPTEKLGHDWSSYQGDATGHWKTCSRCDRTDTGNHSFGKETVIQQATTCGETTVTRRTCQVCNYNQDTEKVLSHSYLQVEESYVEGDCCNDTEYDERCSRCGDVRHVSLPVEGGHEPVEFKAKPVTETEDGNYSYWQCTLCGRYFSSQTCVIEKFAEDIFILAPKYIVLESIDRMVELILNLEADVPSYDIYEITLDVLENVGYGRLWVWDNVSATDDCQILFPATTDLSNIGEGDIITIKGHLVLDDADSYFADAEIISVLSSTGSDLFTMNMSVNDTNLGNVVAESECGETFSDNTNSPQSLVLGETVTFTCYGNKDGAVLKSIIVNGKAYSTDENGQFSVRVTGDINAQFVYDTTNEMSVKIDNINTSVWDADPYTVNEYLTYEYDGNTNDSGRLYKGSFTRFVVNNAYVTGVVIEYQNYKLDEVVHNTINVGTDRLHKSAIDAYEINPLTKKATLEFAFASALGYFEYNADNSQARIVSITFTYATHNVLASRSANA